MNVDYWTPPDGYVFDASSKSTTLKVGIVKTTNVSTGVVNYFENYNLAATYLKLDQRQVLEATLHTSKNYKGYLFEQTEAGIGTWTSTKPNVNPTIIPFKPAKETTPVIMDSVVNNESFYFSSEKGCADKLDILPDGRFNFFRNFLDKPRQCKGFHIRSVNSPKWIPNNNFVFNKLDYYKRFFSYIESHDPVTGEKKFYEGIAGYNDLYPKGDATRNGISINIDKNKLYKSRIWRKINLSDPNNEVGTFVQVTQSASSST